MTVLDALPTNTDFPRQYLPADLDLGSWDNIARFYDELEARPLPDAAALEKWLLDWSELFSAVSEEFTRRHIRMTCHTDDPELERAYLDYLQDIMPKMEPRNFALSRRYLDCPHRAALPRHRYEVFDRARANEVEIFREENVPLATQDEMLAQRYQKICGEMTATLRGEELTIPQLQKLLEEPDRALRREAWIAAVTRQLRDRETLEDLFDEMLALRQQMALNAGFPNFLAYQFRRLGRFDYAPTDCVQLHEAIEKVVVPACRRLLERRRVLLGLDRLAPWDLQVDPSGLPPLRPFETSEQLMAGTTRIFAAVDPSFPDDFSVLQTLRLLDLDNRKAKAPGGYQSTLDEVRLPFIFMNATGRNRDVFTLLHEGGHAFHALAARHEPLLPYRSAPIEFCEVASMGMEMMACEKLDAFYDAASAQRARREHLEEVILILPWIARVDAMQHWMYTNPGHTRAQRAHEWLRLDKRFGSDLDWTELSEWRECSWIHKLHFFCVPLYYIEYAIAQIGALQLWSLYRANPRDAVAGYRRALALGGSRPLPELFATAGIRFALDQATLEPLVAEVESALSSN
ncbi:MAG: M3 family oligoendopeptidase [Candidatus Sumerlaeaceae bacterium]|nr:M3 family oligoendopeptidase [Candidatus Sumerlaeaceae bacterium]